MPPPINRIDWRPSYRIIPSRFPPVGLFDSIASPDDFEALYEIESLTNPRLRAELGAIDLIPADRRIAGAGTTPIMAAFTHFNPEGSRFTPGTYGVYYAAVDRATAIAETAHHRSRFLAATKEGQTVLEMRCYLGDISGEMHDIRGGWADLHHPESYAASQAFAVRMKEAGSNGIVYDSVRNPGGHCVAAFYPDLVSPVLQSQHLHYHWDGARITHVVVAGEIIELPAAN